MLVRGKRTTISLSQLLRKVPGYETWSIYIQRTSPRRLSRCQSRIARINWRASTSACTSVHSPRSSIISRRNPRALHRYVERHISKPEPFSHRATYDAFITQQPCQYLVRRPARDSLKNSCTARISTNHHSVHPTGRALFPVGELGACVHAGAPGNETRRTALLFFTDREMTEVCSLYGRNSPGSPLELLSTCFSARIPHAQTRVSFLRTQSIQQARSLDNLNNIPRDSSIYIRGSQQYVHLARAIQYPTSKVSKYRSVVLAAIAKSPF